MDELCYYCPLKSSIILVDHNRGKRFYHQLISSRTSLFKRNFKRLHSIHLNSKNDHLLIYLTLFSMFSLGLILKIYMILWDSNNSRYPQPRIVCNQQRQIHYASIKTQFNIEYCQLRSFNNEIKFDILCNSSWSGQSTLFTPVKFDFRGFQYRNIDQKTQRVYHVWNRIEYLFSFSFK